MNPEKRALVAILTQQQLLLDLEQELKRKDELIEFQAQVLADRRIIILTCQTCLEYFIETIGRIGITFQCGFCEQLPKN